MRSRGRILALAVALVAALVALAAWQSGAGQGSATQAKATAPPPAAVPLLLFTSLPIYWNESADIGSLLSSNEPAHWARTAIEAQRPLRPVDTLDPVVLNRARDLLAVQPRALSPQENVALDDWVGAGGRVLLFVDPALTAESAFAIGDKRRPQAIAMLSPILARWGLELTVDEDQSLGERTVTLAPGTAVPVNLPGRFAPHTGGRGDARCRIEAEGLLADCAIGQGHVVALADAALFEPSADPADTARRRAALTELMRRGFSR